MEEGQSLIIGGLLYPVAHAGAIRDTLTRRLQVVAAPQPHSAVNPLAAIRAGPSPVLALKGAACKPAQCSSGALSTNIAPLAPDVPTSLLIQLASHVRGQVGPGPDSAKHFMKSHAITGQGRLGSLQYSPAWRPACHMEQLSMGRAGPGLRPPRRAISCRVWQDCSAARLRRVSFGRHAGGMMLCRQKDHVLR